MPEKKKKRKNKVIEAIKNLSSTERGRAVLFFGFYLIFFFVVIVLVRTSHNAPTRTNETIQKTVSYSYNLERLEKRNYHFKYLSTIGEDIILYEGDRFQTKEFFQVMTNALVNYYYRDGELFIKQENTSWVVSDTPYVLDAFYDVDMIGQILEKAEFIAKTEYNNTKLELQFRISTKELIKLFKLQDIPIINEEQNEIVLELDQDKNIERIEYDLTNFYTTAYQVPKKVFIEMTYSNFGKVKEIEKP